MIFEYIFASYSAAVSSFENLYCCACAKEDPGSCHESADTNERSKNVIIYGLEMGNEQLQNKVEEVLMKKPLIELCQRAKKDGSGTLRMVH